MKSKISGIDYTSTKTQAMKGGHLRQLKEFFGNTSTVFLSNIGLSAVTFSKNLNAERLPIPLSILTRLLFRNPELYPQSETITFNDIHKLVSEIYPAIKEEAQIPLLFGLHPSNKKRFFSPVSQKNTPTVEAMKMMFVKGLNAEKTKAGKKNFITLWVQCVEEEALSKGVDLDVFWKSHNPWSPKN